MRGSGWTLLSFPRRERERNPKLKTWPFQSKHRCLDTISFCKKMKKVLFSLPKFVFVLYGNLCCAEFQLFCYLTCPRLLQIKDDISEYIHTFVSLEKDTSMLDMKTVAVPSTSSRNAESPPCNLFCRI